MAEYRIKKAALREDRRFPWLNDFETNLDDAIARALEPISAQIPRYNCYQVEDLISEVSKSLERCLVYRREHNDLEAAAFKAALDYELFEKTLVFNRDLEAAAWIEQQRRSEQEAQGAIQGAFSGDDPISRGFREISIGTARATGIAITGEEARKRYAEGRWNELTQYQDTLRSRHTTPGHPLNFTERADKVKAFLIDDLKEAYEKARAIKGGARLVYGIEDDPSASFPDYRQAGLLDRLILWIRSLIRTHQLLTWRDVDFELVVNGRQPVVQRNGNQLRLIADADFNSRIQRNASGLFEFDVGRYFEQVGEVKHLRTRGVGLSISGADLSAPARLYRVAAMVFPPAAQSPYEQGAFIPRMPIILQNVAVTDPAQRVRSSSPDSVKNIDPKGTWRVQLSTSVAYPDLSAHGRPDQVTDIKLHLFMTGQPSQRVEDWRDFWW